VYVDGFNLYYGAMQQHRGPGLKWLDLNALFVTLFPDYEIQRIRYFTAKIKARPDDPDGPQRQNTYLRALRTLPNVHVTYGNFLVSTKRMPLANPPLTGPRTIEVIKTEEKGSDVNLATYLVIDTMRGDCDVAVVVSNDSDLCEPIRIVNDEINVPVVLLNPHPSPSAALKRLLPRGSVRPIRQGPLRASQFPENVTTASGRIITKPSKW
jgi:hypothetical protein